MGNNRDDAASERQTLVVGFESLAAAEDAIERLRASGLSDENFRITAPGDTPRGAGSSRNGDASCQVTADLPLEAMDPAIKILQAQGGVILEEPSVSRARAGYDGEAHDRAHAPRPVQDGFTDVAPGFVPKFAPGD